MIIKETWLAAAILSRENPASGTCSALPFYCRSGCSEGCNRYNLKAPCLRVASYKSFLVLSLLCYCHMNTQGRTLIRLTHKQKPGSSTIGGHPWPSGQRQGIHSPFFCPYVDNIEVHLQKVLSQDGAQLPTVWATRQIFMNCFPYFSVIFFLVCTSVPWDFFPKLMTYKQGLVSGSAFSQNLH